MARPLTRAEQEDLLKRYAPVLRFSAGENFFPMDVREFIAACPRLKMGKRPMKEWSQLKGADERIAFMVKQEQQQDLHLQFLIKDFPDYFQKAVLTLAVSILVFFIVWGVSELADLLPGAALDGWAFLKIGLLAFGIILYPLINADSKVYLAILVNLFGLFFFGTLYAVGFGILGLVLLAGFAGVHFTFRCCFGRLRRIAPSCKWVAPLLHGVSLALSTLLAYAIGLGLHLWARDFPDISLIFGAVVYLFYGLLLLSQAVPKSISKERKAMFLLLVLILLVLAFYGYTTGRPGLDEAYTFVGTIALSSAGLLWYALDPLSVTKPGPLGRDDDNNFREEQLAWNFKVLGLMTGAFLLFTIFSWFFSGSLLVRISEIVTGVMVYSLVSAANLVLSVGILGTSVASFFLDLFSGMDNSDAPKARLKYDELKRVKDAQVLSMPFLSTLPNLASQVLRRETPEPPKERYVYYGCVRQQENWVILQYNYFYAFNDWRSTALGMNNHEGDWEAVSIFLLDETKAADGAATKLKPFGVAYSQHKNGDFKFWDEVRRVNDPREDSHPLVYVALGSHANYPLPEVSPPSIHFGGAARSVVAKLEGFIRLFRERLELPTVKEALQEARELGGSAAMEADFEPVKGGELTSGSLEYHAGDGVRIGYRSGETVFSGEAGYAPNLPESISRREGRLDGRPGVVHDWELCLLDEAAEPWVNFRGRWGRKGNVEGEDGPQGPKWDGLNPRLRWGGREPGYYLEWLDVLLMETWLDGSRATLLRRKALQQLSERGMV